jgi:Cys-rich four helix bundle protein (predicted Tat secretion target)
MNRRNATGALGALIMAGLAERALAQTPAPHDHNHAPGAPMGAPSAPVNDPLRASAAACVSTGQVCLAHCIRTLSTGDKTMGDCAKSINQLLAICGALESLTAQGSAFVPAMAKIALESCNRCAELCKPHTDHHPECRACYESCLECAKQCKAIG